MRTYQAEMTLATIYLTVVLIVTADVADPRALVSQAMSTIAVVLTFGHMTVSSRLEEAQERLQTKSVDCYALLTRYLVAKEVVWVLAFIALEAWVALAGVPLFILYPVWRRWYRAHYPAKE